MKNLINKTNCIAILVAIFILVSVKPTNAQWVNQYPTEQKDDNTLMWVCIGAGALAIIVAVVSISKKNKKNKATSANLMFNNDYLTLNKEFAFYGKYQNINFGTKNNFESIEPIRLDFKPILLPKNTLFKSTYSIGFSSLTQFKPYNNNQNF